MFVLQVYIYRVVNIVNKYVCIIKIVKTGASGCIMVAYL